MKGKLKIAGILAIILLALGGLATWDEWKTKREKEDEKTKNKLAEFKPEDVIELDYYSKGTTPEDGAEAPKPDDNPKPEGVVEISAVKKDGVWRLTKPLDVQADAQTLDALVKTVTEYSYNKVISEKRETWAEYGLLEPQRHVTLRVGGDKPQALTVFIGNKAPLGYNVYLRTSKDDKVLMGSQHLLISSSKTLNDFRDKTLVKIDEGKLKVFTYARKGQPAIEVTKADGKYSVTKPEKLDGDSAAIKELIEELNATRVVSFSDNPDDATKALFQSPDYELVWQGESGEASTLKLAEKGGKLYAAFDPAQRVYSLPDELKGKLKKDLNDFRNRRILEPDSLDAKTVEIDGETFKNVEGNWYATADADTLDATGKPKDQAKPMPAERANIRAFMVDLEFAKTDRFIPLEDPAAKALEKDAPQHRIALRYHDPAKQPVTIDLYKAEGADDRFLVRRSGAGYVYRVAKAAFNSMTPGKEPVPGESPGIDGGGPEMPTDMPADDDDEGLNLPANPQG